MLKSAEVFQGCLPALMTPCREDRSINYEALVQTGQKLVAAGMRGVIYCGSMGDWPLLTDAQRQEGVSRLTAAGLPVVVGTGAQNTRLATEHAAHAEQVGAAGLMLIPRVLSRGSSVAAQRAHFSAILGAAPSLPAVIYNSPYYGFQTDGSLFTQLRHEHENLVGFKEFGGAAALSAAAEWITSGDPALSLMVGVDTQVFHGFVRCGAVGAITGIGNALPEPVLRLVQLCRAAASGSVVARRLAQELDEALTVLSRFDEGPDLVLYYKFLMVLGGDAAYEYQLQESDTLTPTQRAFAKQHWDLFQSWWSQWPGATGTL